MCTCPSCKHQWEEELKIRSKLTLTLDTGVPRVTIPRDSMNQIIHTFIKVKGFTMDQKSFIIYGKQAKELYIFCDKDLAKVLVSIEKAKEYYDASGFDKWTLSTIIKQWDVINKPEENKYKGW